MSDLTRLLPIEIQVKILCEVPPADLAVCREVTEMSRELIEEIIYKSKRIMDRRRTVFSEQLAHLNRTLLKATRLGQILAARRLLSIPEVDVNYADEDGKTALHFAAEIGGGGVDMAFILLSSRSKDIDVNARCDDMRSTPLAASLTWGVDGVATLLLRLRPDVDVNLRDRSGNTALHQAVLSDAPPVPRREPAAGQARPRGRRQERRRPHSAPHRRRRRLAGLCAGAAGGRRRPGRSHSDAGGAEPQRIGHCCCELEKVETEDRGYSAEVDNGAVGAFEHTIDNRILL